MTSASPPAVQPIVVPNIPVMRPALGEEEARAAADAVTSGWVAQGPRVAAFEAGVSAAVGADQGVALSSCTAALHLALVLLDVKPGDEVIVPSLSFIATANSVRYVGATPVFADVDPVTLNLTPASVERARSPRTVAVMLVHQAGVPADIQAIRAVCEPHGLAIIEDAACALGATLRGRPIGSHSDLVAFSFHPRKVITTGEGGMLMVRGEEVAGRARRLREHGMSVSAAERHSRRDLVIESYLETGFNYRMTDVQAAIGLVQLGRLSEIVQRRRELAHRYQAMLGGAPVRTIADPSYALTNYQSFWVQLNDEVAVDRDDVLRRMGARGVMARRGIMASHLEPAYAAANSQSLPVTEEASRRSLILPLFHDMTAADQERVVETFLAAVAGSGT